MHVKEEGDKYVVMSKCDLADRHGDRRRTTRSDRTEVKSMTDAIKHSSDWMKKMLKEYDAEERKEHQTMPVAIKAPGETPIVVED